MDLFMKFLNEANYLGAYLWTTNSQIQAAALYTRYGFKMTEEKESSAFGRLLTEQRYDYRVMPTE
jgi:peptidyl-dipeptidase Dcp